MKLKILAGLALLIMPLAASATTIAPPEYWEEYEEEAPTRFVIEVVPIPEKRGDADLPEYVPKIKDFVPCRWVVPIIPILQERESVMTDSDNHDPIITGYRSGSPQCIPDLNEWRRGRDW